jgi:hypothetical protein
MTASRLSMFWLSALALVVSTSALAATKLVGVDCNGPVGNELQASPGTVVVSANDLVQWGGSLSCDALCGGGATYEIVVPAGPFGGPWTSPKTALSPTPLPITSPAVVAQGRVKYTVNIYNSAGVLCKQLDPIIVTTAFLPAVSAPALGVLFLLLLAAGAWMISRRRTAAAS